MCHDAKGRPSRKPLQSADAAKRWGSRRSHCPSAAARTQADWLRVPVPSRRAGIRRLVGFAVGSLLLPQLRASSARVACHLTRSTLRGRGRESFTEDAEAIVGSSSPTPLRTPPSAAQCKPAARNPSLRLLRGTTEMVCAVLDPSDEVPVLKSPAGPDETGRGLKIVDTLSDAWELPTDSCRCCPDSPRSVEQFLEDGGGPRRNVVIRKELCTYLKCRRG